MPKVAILVDGGFFSKAVGDALGTRWPFAEVIHRNAMLLILLAVTRFAGCRLADLRFHGGYSLGFDPQPTVRQIRATLP